jgi:transcriptional regulator with XRE-family HTH domain
MNRGHVHQRTTGRTLAARRVKAEVLMREVASAMGVSKSRISSIEHADHVTPAAAQRFLDAVRVAGARRAAR